MIKLCCYHNLLQLQGTYNLFDSASQRVQPTAPTFFWLQSYTDQSNNKQIMRAGNKNDSIAQIIIITTTITIMFMIIIDLTGLSWM